MDDEFTAIIGFVTIGSLCIIISTFLMGGKLGIGNIELIVSFFLLSGILFILSSAILLFRGVLGALKDNYKKNVLFYLIFFAIVFFFGAGIMLLINYLRFLWFPT